MAKTYATIEGCRMPKTCTGGNDGVRASAQSYDGSVIVSNWYDGDEVMFRIGTNDRSGCYSDWNSSDFIGTFEDIKKALELLCKVKCGEASVVTHRKPKEAN